MTAFFIGALYTFQVALVLYNWKKLDESNKSRKALIDELEKDIEARERHTEMMGKLYEQVRREKR